MEILLGYLAGLFTLINPCVLPVLPIVLATALQASRWGPVALAAGMSLVFVAVGLGVTAFGRGFGIDDQRVAQVGAVLMIGFGAVLLVPAFSRRFEMATAGVATRADAGMDELDRGSRRGQFLGGMRLGAVWSPCVGPTLGGAISLAAQGESLLWAGAIMTSFALGISTIILALGYGARSVIMKRQATMRALATKARPIMGIIFVLVGLMILLETYKYIEIWLIQVLPFWLQDLSVRF
jgi:cytochrome c biogenesis protein CcdA